MRQRLINRHFSSESSAPFERETVAQSIASYIRAADSLQPQSAGLSQASQTSHSPSCGQSKSVSRNLVTLGNCLYLLAYSTLLFITAFVIGVWSTYHIDYDYLMFIAKRNMTGHTTDSCLDLPEEYWRLHPKCTGEAETEPSHSAQQ